MILLELKLINKEQLQKFINLISNYNMLNDDKIEVEKIFEFKLTKANNEEDLKTDEC